MASVPPKSRRGRILDALEAQLRTITQANGYATNVIGVSTDVKIWNDLDDAQTPILYIVDEKTKYNYHAGRMTERDWTVSIFGVMKGGKKQEDMEELIADIEDCIMANIRLPDSLGNPTVSHIRITDIITDRQLFSELEGSCLFKVILEIKYIATVDNVR